MTITIFGHIANDLKLETVNNSNVFKFNVGTDDGFFYVTVFYTEQHKLQNFLKKGDLVNVTGDLKVKDNFMNINTVPAKVKFLSESKKQIIANTIRNTKYKLLSKVSPENFAKTAKFLELSMEGLPEDYNEWLKATKQTLPEQVAAKNKLSKNDFLKLPADIQKLLTDKFLKEQEEKQVTDSAPSAPTEPEPMEPVTQEEIKEDIENFNSHEFDNKENSMIDDFDNFQNTDLPY